MANPATLVNLLPTLFAAFLVTVGAANLIWVHPVPGLAYLLVALLYVPAVTAWLKKWLGFGIPAVVKIGLAAVIVLFTFGVSDLGDKVDKL